MDGSDNGLPLVIANGLRDYSLNRDKTGPNFEIVLKIRDTVVDSVEKRESVAPDFKEE